ncbi:MAG: hypothetical protein B6D39_06560 [Anaerolineae bacterium UTCFX2]|jgi:hypothetical protein|nr:MAG: hypothetical protein B6D39_06560 [Anaerolineae bacterium UTCFX2]
MASSVSMAVWKLPSYSELALFVKTYLLCYRHVIDIFRGIVALAGFEVVCGVRNLPTGALEAG